MNEFRISSSNYVSDWGGDNANAGTNPELPKKTINATALPMVVGAGQYNGNITGAKTMVADGAVILDGLNNVIGNVNAFTATGIYFRNHLAQLGSASNFAIFNDCIFENCPRINFRAHLNTGNVLLEGSPFLPTNNSFQLNYSLLLESLTIPSTVATSNAFTYNYLAKGKRVVFPAANVALIQNCMINGVFQISGTDYELKKLFDGSARPDADGGILDFETVYPSVYTNGNFAGDPKFIDVKNRIVDASSDLLKRITATGSIGKVNVGNLIKKDGSDANTFISTSQINTSTDEWEIAGGFSEGFIEIITRLSTNLVQIPRINYVGLLDFAGTSPDNVPDFFPNLYTVLSATGLRPNRLTFKLRSSRLLAKPTFESDWDNNAVDLGTTAGAFYDHEYGRIPTITDVSSVKYGNAQPETFALSGSTITARWIHIKIRLTNLRAY